MQGGILPTEEKLITDDSVPKRIYLNLPRKRSMFFFLMNESNVYDSKFIFKMEKTKNDLNFQKFADGKTKRRREDQQKFLLPPLFLSLLLSTVAVSQLFFFFIIMCYIYIYFYLFMLLIILLFYSISM